MTGWGELATAYALFVLAHLLPARPPVRRRLTGMLGERRYLLLYGLLSLALLGWLLAAAGRAPYLALWQPAPWQRWLALAAMSAACLLVALAVGTPNPFSFGGGSGAFDPAHPGIVALTRHPLLWALALWAGAHLLANGDLAHALLFGGFLLMALAGMAALDRRARLRLGPAWRELAQPRAPGWRRRDLLRVAAALLLFAGLLLAHPPLIGVDPLAGL
ncbi:MAG: NnrU family protein [Geminicoccaceae bacterium]